MGFHMNKFLGRVKYLCNISFMVDVMILVALLISVPALAVEQEESSHDQVAERAKAAWLDGTPTIALEILDQEVPQNSGDLGLQKLRG